MTDWTFGRAHPVHFMMLDFACWQKPPGSEDMGWPALSHEQKLVQIVQGRANLFYATEQDFGFSLKAWRDYFIASAERGEDPLSYCLGPWQYVDQAILKVIGDPQRALLEEEARGAQARIEPTPQPWWPGEKERRGR